MNLSPGIPKTQNIVTNCIEELSSKSLKPRGKHSEIAGFLAYRLNIAIRDRNLNAFIPRECLLKPHRSESGYEPDVIICDRTSLQNKPYWETASAISKGR